MNSKLSTRPATYDDIDKILDIHRKSLPGSLLDRLGAPFLKKRLFPFALTNPDVKLNILLDNKEAIGFTMYTRTMSIIPEEFKKHKLEILCTIIRKSLSDPELFYDCLGSHKKKRVSWTYPRHLNPFYLFLIAIVPDKQYTGYGSYFLNHTLQLMKEWFSSNHCLVDARKQGVCNFYIKNNFVEIGQEKRGHNNYFKLIRDCQL